MQVCRLRMTRHDAVSLITRNSWWDLKHLLRQQEQRRACRCEPQQMAGRSWAGVCSQGWMCGSVRFSEEPISCSRLWRHRRESACTHALSHTHTHRHTSRLLSPQSRLLRPESAQSATHLHTHHTTGLNLIYIHLVCLFALPSIDKRVGTLLEPREIGNNYGKKQYNQCFENYLPSN